MVLDVARRARQAGAIVTFDPNYRPALWESPAAAAAAMEPVLEHVDWYLCGAEEASALGTADLPQAVVRTARAAVLVGERIEVPAPGRETVVDEVGAGDAFAAGFAYGLLRAGRRAPPSRRRTPSRPGRCAAPATGRPCPGAATSSPTARTAARCRTRALPRRGSSSARRRPP